MKPNRYSIPYVTVLASLALPEFAQSCNPIINTCTPNLGLATSTYSIDFTKETTLPPGWTISNYANVPFGPQGAEFTFTKRYDAPQLWTDFYILFGRVETVMQVAPGQGIVSSAVLISDDLDEIDWEFSGNNFNLSTSGLGQNNYYGKGITGNYDRGQFFNVASPQSQFHTYTTDWTPTQLTWSVDGVVVRTLLASDCQAKGSDYQYPQSPSKFQLGIWDGGDASTSWGTVSWAGGYTDLTKAPFTMYVKSVTITNANPAYAYNYTDRSGSWESIQFLKQTVSSTSSTNTIASTTAAGASTSVVAKISSSLSSLGHLPTTSTTATLSATAVSTTKVATTQATNVGSTSVSTSSVTKLLPPTTASSSSTHATTTIVPTTTSTTIPLSLTCVASKIAAIKQHQPSPTSFCSSWIAHKPHATSPFTEYGILLPTGVSDACSCILAGYLGAGVASPTTRTHTSVLTASTSTYSPYWHYYRNNGHEVRSWW